MPGKSSKKINSSRRRPPNSIPIGVPSGVLSTVRFFQTARKDGLRLSLPGGVHLVDERPIISIIPCAAIKIGSGGQARFLFLHLSERDFAGTNRVLATFAKAARLKPYAM